MGIPVRENILQVPLSDLCKYQDKLQEAIREFQKNLFLLRGVCARKEVTIKEDAHGNLTFELGKDKRWFTGTRGNEWTWLDMEEYSMNEQNKKAVFSGRKGKEILWRLS